MLVLFAVICHRQESHVLPSVTAPALPEPKVDTIVNSTDSSFPVIGEPTETDLPATKPASPAAIRRHMMEVMGGPALGLGSHYIKRWAPGEYSQFCIRDDGQGGTITSDPALMGSGGVGTEGIFNPVGTSATMVFVISNLHSGGFIDNTGTVWFAGESDNNPYITGNNIYSAALDSGGNVITGGFSVLATCWQPAEAPSAVWYGVRNSDSSLMVCGDTKHGMRGIHGVAGQLGSKWVPVPMPNGEKVKSILGSIDLMILTWSGHVYTIGNSGSYQANLGWGSPSFGELASAYSSNYDQPNELQYSGSPLAHIRMIAGGGDLNWEQDSTGNIYVFTEFGWRVGHTTSVSADQLATPTLMNSKLIGTGLMPRAPDTIVVDGACTHFLVNGSIYGVGSTEQGTLGNGMTLDYSSTSPPYFNGGGNENSGALVQFIVVNICPGKSNFMTLYNGMYYNYYDEAKDSTVVTDWGWGRNKAGAMSSRTVPIDTAATLIQSSYPDSWNRPQVSELFNPTTGASVYRSTSPGCYNACTPGTQTGSPCSTVTPICYTNHAALSVTSIGTKVMLNATASTSTGILPYVTFSYVSGPGAPNMGAKERPVTMTDTFNVSLTGTYTFKVVVKDPNWGADSTTSSITVSSAQNYYMKNGGTGSGPCTSSVPCPMTLFNSLFAAAIPGDTFFLARNDVYPYELTANASGSNGNPIVVTAWGTGNLPVIGGMSTLSGWTVVGGLTNVWEVPYTGPAPTLLTTNGVLTTQSRSPNLATGYFIPTSMTASTITDATNAGLVRTGTKIAIRSSNYTIDTALVTGVSGSVISYSPSASYNPSTTGGLGWMIMDNTPDSLEWQDTLGQLRIYSIATPPALYQIPTVDTPLLDEGTYQVWDHIRIEGGNSAGMIFAFQTANTTLSNDSIDLCLDGIQLRGESRLNLLNTVIIHCSNDGVLKQSNTNFWNTYKGVTVYDAGMLPGMGRPGINQNYSGLVAGDSASSVTGSTIDSVGYCGIANYGPQFIVDTNRILNFCQILGDGGGVYTYSNVIDTVTTQRYILGNLVLGGGTAASNNGMATGWFPSVCGVYLDDASSNTLVQHNTVGGVNWVGIFDHGPKNSFLNNTTFGSGFSEFLAYYCPGCAVDITSLNVQNNNFNALGSGNAIALETINASVGGFGTFNNNTFNHYTSTTPFWKKDNTGAASNMTLASWRSTYSFETSSTLSALNLTLVPNIAFTTQVVNAHGTYKTIAGGWIYNLIQIPSLSGVLLQPVNPGQWWRYRHHP